MLKQWLLSNANASVKGSVAYRFRKKRMQIFEDFYNNFVLQSQTNELQPIHSPAILDVGGEWNFWSSMNFKYIDNASITLLNITAIEIPSNVHNVASVVGDATDLKQYSDRQFDLVFSNSVIEHVGDFNSQKKMAQEMMRTGRHCYLQTPNKFFPIEPHFLFPFFQFLPLRLRALLIKNLGLGYPPKAKTYEEALERAKSVRLLTKKELSTLFPGIEIRKEKIGFLTKSFYLFF